MWDDAAAGVGGTVELLERARSALTKHLPPSVAEALVVLEGAAGPRPTGRAPGGPAGPGDEEGHIVARLCIDPKTKGVFVRFYDRRSGATIREVTPTYVAEVITRLAPTIANESE